MDLGNFHAFIHLFTIYIYIALTMYQTHFFKWQVIADKKIQAKISDQIKLIL